MRDTLHAFISSARQANLMRVTLVPLLTIKGN